MYSTDEWANATGYHPAKDVSVQEDHEKIRQIIYQAGLKIFEILPFPSPQATKVSNYLLDAMFWSNHTIATTRSPLDETSLDPVPESDG